MSEQANTYGLLGSPIEELRRLKAALAEAHEVLRGLRDAVDEFGEVLIVPTGDEPRFVLGERDAVVTAWVGPVENAMHAADALLTPPAR